MASTERKISARRKLRHFWRQLQHEQATPTRLGIAVFVGVMVGCSPFYGLQMIMAVALAWALRLNRIAVLLGANISVPPLTPFIILAGIQVGEYMLNGRFLALTLQSIRATPPKQLLEIALLDLFFGGLVVGAVLGGLLGYLTFRAVRASRAKTEREPHLEDEELDGMLDAFDALPRQFRHYGAWKLRLDPVYPMVLPELMQAKQLVDLGGGMGLLALLARRRFPELQIRLVEWDARKADIARKLTATASIQVEQADARQVELGEPDAICLLDVLHYFPVAEQRAWLQRCAEALAPGGALIVRDLDSPGQGSWAEKIDAWAVKTGWNKAKGVKAWPVREMARLLAEQGFDVAVRPAGKGLFKANSLLVARKRRAL